MLPAKPVFFRYVAVLCCINAGAAVGACLLGLHVRLGYCLYGLAELLYNALLPPVWSRYQNSFLSVLCSSNIHVHCRPLLNQERSINWPNLKADRFESKTTL